MSSSVSCGSLFLFDKESSNVITSKFTVTENHLKLAKKMYVLWSPYGRFGAPCIDPKRPYGNSEVFEDIAEVIGMKQPDYEEDEDWTDDQARTLLGFHEDMKKVLQIAIRTGKFEVGEYECSDYWEWTKIG